MKNISTFCLTALATATFAHPSFANDGHIEHIQVSGSNLFNGNGQSMASLIGDQVDFSAAGGVSALPVINGLMGDRVAVTIDGASITSACANQMNPPLSYVSPSQVHSASVFAGVSPVSFGGDNIAGVIRVETIEPIFSDTDSLAFQSGYLGSHYRSNNNLKGIDAGFQLASESVSVSYTGAFEDAESYEDGNGDTVFDTLYRAQNHSFTAAIQDESEQFAIKLTHQSIPFQGFPNQYMDMTDNSSLGVVARYTRQFDDQRLQIQANWHQVTHEMGFFTDEKTGMMPMDTDAIDRALTFRWDTNLTQSHSLAMGLEYHDYRLDDWWPAIADSMMMGPNDYININDGTRKRLAAYLESSTALSSHINLLAGIRVEDVTTDAGEVSPYNRMPMMGMPNVDAEAADDFNAADRKQSDFLTDISLLLTYSASSNHQWQFGLARKNRAPNLYERYSWGRGTMATTMIGWFGDGNGYIGNIELKPETATTASITYSYANDADTTSVSVTPYYTKVADYVDVIVTDTFFAFNSTDNPEAKRNKLQFTNVDATLFGLKISARQNVLESDDAGRFSINASANLTRGSRDDTNDALYQMVPWQIKFSLQHDLGAWQNRLELQWTDDKNRVDPRRLENTTEAFSIVNIYTNVVWQNWQLSAGITNLLDKYYDMPLGGVSVADISMQRSSGFEQLAGEGRSFNIAAKYRF